MAVAKSWTNFTASTTARASQVLGNDAWAEGNIVPHSTGTLANNEFSLGTSTAKWLNIYADKVAISTGTSYFMGNVGIGTTSPSTVSDLTAALTTYTSGNQLQLVGATNGTGQKVGVIFSQMTTAANTARQGGAIYSVAENTYVAGDGTTYDSGLAFYTGLNGTNTEMVRILANGNVGIGTASPASTLHVASASAVPFRLVNGYTPNADRADIAYLVNSTSDNTLRIGSIGTNGGITLQVTKISPSGTKSSLVLNPDGGNVGIGTTAPGKALEINHTTGGCLRLTYNDSNGSAANYADMSVSSGGDLTIAPSGGDTIVAGSLNVSGGIKEVGSLTLAILPKIVSLPGWDMNANSTSSVVLFTGTNTVTNIRSCQVLIWSDEYASASGTLYDLNITYGGSPQGTSHIRFDGSNTVLYMQRTAGGLFDAATFDNSGLIRGRAMLWYDNL